ncbi:MAG: DUF1343 domain-containing protein [Planctomycetaceae bacterium]|nr:DUF1343 domain-containing protein [Planctomycetaceae bacterium]MCB9937028.1 DUF1343 domain-containing protein [Planctomycetaceae bacterium]
MQDRPAMLEGARFGLLMNRASVDRDLRFACDALNDAYPGQLAALFTPQHGLWGDAQANMIETDHGWHAGLDVPIYSLYSETRRPTSHMLAGLDCLVIDLQDVGTRVYTFVWTVLECLKACAAAGIKVLVLDRPNPIGGCIVEGPLLDLDFRSFVGGASIPMRHGLTLGELARLLNSEQAIDAALEVIPLANWSPSETFTSLARVWIPPSPNLPRVESALIYPGQVLLEGTNLSEGRGTTTPFEVTGASFIDAEVLCDDLTDRQLPGVRFLPLAFRPMFDKWAGELCQGVSIHITDFNAYRPLRTTIALLAAVRRRWPQQFQWLAPPYEYETVKPPIDIISGSARLQLAIESGDDERLPCCPLTLWQERTCTSLLYGSAGERFVL